MWTWVWPAIAVVLFFALGRAKMKWRQQELALESYAVLLLFSDDLRRNHQVKLRDWVRNFPAQDALSLSTNAHVAIGEMVSGLAASGTLNSGAHAALWQIKKEEVRS